MMARLDRALLWLTLAEAPRTLAADPDRREVMGEVGRARARDYDAPLIAALRPAA